MKKMIFLISCVLVLCISACSSDDDPKPIQDAPRSMITEFIAPQSLFHQQSDFNVEFVKNEKTNMIDEIRILDFTIIGQGESIDYASRPKLFVETLQEIGDTCAPENLPEEAWNYCPPIIPVSTINIFIDDANEALNLVENEECSKYFEISYVSYYDFIKNGYSWKGIEKPGPIYKMSIEDFNRLGDKKLVDMNNIKLHLPKELQTIEANNRYLIELKYADGTVCKFRCEPVPFLMWDRLWNIMKDYNTGFLTEFPNWNLLKAPRK